MLNVQKVSPIKVEDNFLRQGEFETLKEWFVNSRSDIDNCPWMYSPHVIGPQGDDPNDFQFIHVFWFPNRGVVSQHIDVISPIMRKINPKAWLRIKANLQPKNIEVYEDPLHVDLNKVSCTTSIFYVNTCNGYTYFEDGSKVESVANRLVTFPSQTKHAGTTCSDQVSRVVINFNYHKYYD